MAIHCHLSRLSKECGRLNVSQPLWAFMACYRDNFTFMYVYILNRVGDIGHPCSKPFVLQNPSDKFDLTRIFILHLLLLYVFLTASVV
jgi:hypothetical protein